MEEEVRTRHRREQKELQALIMQKKKAASKKTRKGVGDECARLEAEMRERQERELRELVGDGGVDKEEEGKEGEAQMNGGTDAVTNGVASLSVVGDEVEADVAKEQSTTPAATTEPQQPQSQQRGKKPNRQKARLARRAAELEEETARAEEEAQSMPDLRAREQETMDAAARTRGLCVKEIRADGHCLYSAVADQLKERHISLTPRIRASVVGNGEGGKEDKKEEAEYRTVRRAAAEYIRRHGEEFEPFLEEGLETYVRKVGETGEWGGQLELLALAKAYQVDVSVLDGNGSVHEFVGSQEGEIKKQEKDDERRLWLAYHRHGFGLGEHYNSLRKKDG